MRSLGVLLISSVPAVLGIFYYFKEVNELNLIKQGIIFITVLKDKMRFSLNEISRLLTEIKSDPRLKGDMENIIYDIINGGTDNGDLPFAKDKLSKKYSADTLRLFTQLFYSLGKSDLSGQIAHLEYCRSAFNQSFKEKNNLIKEKGKLYLSLGFFAGAGVFIVLI